MSTRALSGTINSLNASSILYRNDTGKNARVVINYMSVIIPTYGYGPIGFRYGNANTPSLFIFELPNINGYGQLVMGKSLAKAFIFRYDSGGDYYRDILEYRPASDDLVITGTSAYSPIFIDSSGRNNTLGIPTEFFLAPNDIFTVEYFATSNIPTTNYNILVITED